MAPGQRKGQSVVMSKFSCWQFASRHFDSWQLILKSTQAKKILSAPELRLEVTLLHGDRRRSRVRQHRRLRRDPRGRQEGIHRNLWPAPPPQKKRN
jgi:hypothetical protein